MLKAVHEILEDSVLVQAQIGSRYYPVIIPQGVEYPAIAYSIVSNNPSETKSGPSRVDQYRIEFNVYGYSYESVDDTCEALRDTIDFLGPAEWAGQYIEGVKYIAENDLYEQDLRLFRRSVEYYFRLKRA